MLHKLEMEGSARTIMGHYAYLNGEPINYSFLACSETDEEHYAGREPAGEMHPDTEAFVERGEYEREEE